MQKRLAAVAAAVALVVAAPSASPAHLVKHHVRAVAAKTCSAGFKHAVIGGVEKCLRRGEFCAKRYRSQYRRYGYTCSYSNGYWRLH